LYFQDQIHGITSCYAVCRTKTFHQILLRINFFRVGKISWV